MDNKEKENFENINGDNNTYESNEKEEGASGSSTLESDVIKIEDDSEKPQEKEKKKMSRKKKAIIISSSILVFLICLSAVGLALWNWRPFHKTETITPVKVKSTKEVKAKNINILVCGIDFEEGTSRGHLTDIQMYVHIDVKNKKINILQIPRDTYVTREETYTGKINAIYGRSTENGRKNGIVGLEEYINKAFKLPIDFYATVNMTTFKKVVDSIGGVEVDVPFDLEQDGVYIQKGRQVLNGEQAEAFVRKRKGTGFYNGSDINRIKMQRLFIASLIKKFKDMGFSKGYEVIKSIIDDIDCDMTLGDIKTYGKIIYNIPMKNMEIDLLPGEDLKTDYGQWVYSLHRQETAALLNKKYRTYTQQISADELEIEELVNTVSYNDGITDDLENLLSSNVLPGQKRSSYSDESGEDSSSISSNVSE